jgi:branched-chain amino acid transport system ATP-binding protein|tara:strand:+ start:8361 stop:9110 length:750 start_codon:yes stop_codon:yes gene_type:complete
MALIECHEVTRRFGGLIAVDNVDMTVEAGETRAIIGPNGAGKTTLFNLLTGVLTASEGQVIFEGRNITSLPVHDIIQLGISRTFQLTHLFPELSVLENVRIAAQARNNRRWYFLGGSQIINDSKATALEAIKKLGLGDRATIQAGMLSHGDQRLLEIAMALSQNPRLLLLDEPTQGLSIEETERAINILKDLLNSSDLTVILVEHDMEVVFRLAEKITVLHRGRVIADGSPDTVKADVSVQEAYLGGIE